MDTEAVINLAKSCVDIGYFTDNLPPMLEFWRTTIGLEYEAPVEFNNGLTQYRHKLGNSIIKINTSSRSLSDKPGGYAKLLIAKKGQTTTETLFDPDGNEIVFVPPGYKSITDLGICVRSSKMTLCREFYKNALECTILGTNIFQLGTSIILLEEDTERGHNGHWVNTGFRYFTIHVKRIDDTYASLMKKGVASGEKPYSIGEIARISFIKDPDGRWIEVAQRASLAGPW